MIRGSPCPLTADDKSEQHAKTNSHRIRLITTSHLVRRNAGEQFRAVKLHSLFWTFTASHSQRARQARMCQGMVMLSQELVHLPPITTCAGRVTMISTANRIVQTQVSRNAPTKTLKTFFDHSWWTKESHDSSSELWTTKIVLGRKETISRGNAGYVDCSLAAERDGQRLIKNLPAKNHREALSSIAKPINHLSDGLVVALDDVLHLRRSLGGRPGHS